MAKTDMTGLKYKKTVPDEHRNVLVAYVDFDHAPSGSSIEKRRSTTGYYVELNGAAVTAYNKLQEFSVNGDPLLPATSTWRAEFYALREVVKEIEFLRGIMAFLGFPQNKPTHVHIDSSCAKCH